MRGAIFDWDGILADSHGSLYEANAAVTRAPGVASVAEWVDGLFSGTSRKAS